MKKLLFILLLIPTLCFAQPTNESTVTSDILVTNDSTASTDGETPVIEEPVVEEEVAKDYYVYVRLEDRSGITKEDDAGRSKKCDVVAVLPITNQFTPSAKEKESYLIYKTSLYKSDKDRLLETWVDKDTNKAYRKNKLDIKSLGIEEKKGLVNIKVDRESITEEKTSDDLSMYEVKRIMYVYLQRPITKLANIITRKAWAETVSTINKSGEDYNTLTLWEDDKDGDLVGDTRQETAELYDDDGDLSDAVQIDGSTTNADYFMKITSPVGERHNGTDNGGATIASSGGLDATINILDQYFVVEWLIVSNTQYNDFAIQIRGIGSNSSVIRNNIITDVYNREGIHAQGIGYIYNNIIYDNNASAGGIGLYNMDNASYIYNNTIYGCNYGISEGQDKTYAIKNNIAIGNTTDFSLHANVDADYNASGDSTATGANSVTGVQVGVLYLAGAGDARLLATATDVIDAGTDLSGTFTDDIIGTTRSGWSMGAFEDAITTPSGVGGLDSDTKLLLHFDEADGTTGVDNIQDSSDSDHTITAVGTAQTDDGITRFDNTLLLDGNSDYLTIPDSTDWDIWGDNSTDWTIDMWIKFASATAYNSAVKIIMLQRTDDNNRWYIAHQGSGGEGLYLSGAISGTGYNMNFAGDINDTNWHHIAAVVDATGSAKNVGMYVDGNQVAYQTLTANLTSSGDLWIGSWHDVTWTWDGSMEEVRIQQSNYFSATPASDYSDDSSITPPTTAYSVEASGSRRIILITKFVKKDNGYDRVQWKQNFGWNGIKEYGYF